MLSVVATRHASAITRPGDPGALLLGGPLAERGAESLGAHRSRLGVPPRLGREELQRAIKVCEIHGRGGGGFPLGRKLDAALHAPGRPHLIVNCSESEPASRKDGVLCGLRPHLVLDGAASVARALGTTEVTLHLHGNSVETAGALRAAIGERARLEQDDPLWGISLGPGGYVAGEASAVARFLHEGIARPTFDTHPLARRGPSGRPTVVSNAETMAQAAMLLYLGPTAFRDAGSDTYPGSCLATITGTFDRAGDVLEVVGPATIGAILAEGAGIDTPPRAVLVGGYAGTWLSGPVAWHVPFTPAALGALGASRGCGVIGVLPHDACGLVETARLAGYLAGESAGQCGTCVHGLPSLAARVGDLAWGRCGRIGVRRISRMLESLPGSGACAHPDGVARLVQSALAVFENDVTHHRTWRSCAAVDHPPVFSIPSPDTREGT